MSVHAAHHFDFALAPDENKLPVRKFPRNAAESLDQQWLALARADGANAENCFLPSRLGRRGRSVQTRMIDPAEFPPHRRIPPAQGTKIILRDGHFRGEAGQDVLLAQPRRQEKRQFDQQRTLLPAVALENGKGTMVGGQTTHPEPM